MLATFSISLPVGAAIAALASVLLGLLGIAAAYDERSEWAARPLELAAKFVASIATVGGIVSLAVSTGSIVLYMALFITIVIAGSILWGRRVWGWLRQPFPQRRK